MRWPIKEIEMKLKIIALLLSCVCMSSLKAVVLTNATGNDLKIKIGYSEQCLPDDPLQDLMYSDYMLPSGAKTDISGNPVQNRQKGICYKDIATIKAIVTFTDNDQNSSEVANTWLSINGKDLNNAKIITIKMDSHGKMYLQ